MGSSPSPPSEWVVKTAVAPEAAATVPSSDQHPSMAAASSSSSNLNSSMAPSSSSSSNIHSSIMATMPSTDLKASSKTSPKAAKTRRKKTLSLASLSKLHSGRQHSSFLAALGWDPIVPSPDQLAMTSTTTTSSRSRRKRRRVDAAKEGGDADVVGNDDSLDDDDLEETKKRKALLNAVGEHRLKITFIEFGVPLGGVVVAAGDGVGGDSTSHLQFVRFRGGKLSIIPHGMVGTTESYGEPWQFGSRHVRPDGYSRTVVEWTIRNLTSNRVCVRVETEDEALARETQAKTVCNYLLKAAMDARVQELEAELNALPSKNTSSSSSFSSSSGSRLLGHSEDDHVLGTNTASKADVETIRTRLERKIRILRPKRVLIGPLFFGLHHVTLQDKMKEMIAAAEQPGEER